MRIEEESGRIEMSSVCLCFYACGRGRGKGKEKKGENENRREKKEDNEEGDNWGEGNSSFFSYIFSFRRLIVSGACFCFHSLPYPSVDLPPIFHLPSPLTISHLISSPSRSTRIHSST